MCADIDTRDLRIEVLDAAGNSVVRDKVTISYDSTGEVTATGLLLGDRLFFNGQLRYHHNGEVTRVRRGDLFLWTGLAPKSARLRL